MLLLSSSIRDCVMNEPPAVAANDCPHIAVPLAVRGRMLRPVRNGLWPLLKLAGIGPDADIAMRPPRRPPPRELSGAEFGATGGRRGGRRTPAVVRGRAMGEVVRLAPDWRLSAEAGRPLITR